MSNCFKLFASCRVGCRPLINILSRLQNLKQLICLFIIFFSAFAAPLFGETNTYQVKLLSPMEDEKIILPFPHFRWSEHPAAFKEVASPVSYEIQIAKDANFHKVVDCDTVFLNRYVHDLPLKPGKYFWRVRTILYLLKPSSRSVSGSFTISKCEVVVKVSKPVKKNNHTSEVLRAITKVKELVKTGKSVKLVFPAGDYYFGETFSEALLKFDNCKGVIIEGTGAVMHFSNRKQGLFSAEKSKDIVLFGFTIKYPKSSLFSQGWVKTVDVKNNTVQVLFDKGHKFDRNQMNWKLDFAYLLDPLIDGRLKTKANFFFRFDSVCVKNPDETWTFKVNGKTEQWVVGDRVCFQYRTGSSPLMLLKESESITAYGITSYGVGGFHYAAYGGSVFNILHCKTIIPKGEWMSGNADGLHVRGNKIGPWMEACNFQAMGDDAVALYARPASMDKIHPSGNHKAVICKPDFFNLEAGDEVAFFQPVGGVIILETKVNSVKAIANNQFEVIFEDSIPQNLNITGILQDVVQIWNRSKSSGEFVIRRNHFENIRRFGAVFRAKKGVIEANKYIGMSSNAIVFLNETPWPNGLYPSEIIIRNNMIDDTGFDSQVAKATISMQFTGRNASASTIGPRNILIEGNIIKNCSSPEILLTWTRNAVIRNNYSMLPSGKLIPVVSSIKNSENVSRSEDKD